MGEVETICLPGALYDLLMEILRVYNVHEPKDPDPLWKVAGGNKKEDNQNAAGCDTRKHFLKMQDDDTLKCLKGRIKYIFEDKLKYILIENHLGDTPTKQFVIPKALREQVNGVSSYPEWPPSMVVASHAAVARSNSAECTDLYYARGAQGVRPVNWIYGLWRHCT